MATKKYPSAAEMNEKGRVEKGQNSTSGWISVGERLPVGGIVLVSDGFEYAVARHCDISGWNPEGISAWDADLSFEPTHWQLLTEPPANGV